MNNISEFKKELETALDVYKKAKIFLKENEETARDGANSIFNWAEKDSSDIMESLIGWWIYLSYEKKDTFKGVDLWEKVKKLGGDLDDALENDMNGERYRKPTEKDESEGFLWKDSKHLMLWFDEFGSLIENSLDYIKENVREKVIIGELKHEHGKLEKFLIRNISDFTNPNNQNPTFQTPVIFEKLTVFEIPVGIEFDKNKVNIKDEKELEKYLQKHKITPKKIEGVENTLVETSKELDVKNYLLNLTKEENSIFWDMYVLQKLKRKVFYTDFDIEEKISELTKKLLRLKHKISTIKSIFRKPLKTTIEKVEGFEKEQYHLYKKNQLEQKIKDATKELEQLKTTQGELKVTDLKKTIKEQEDRVCGLTNRLKKIENEPNVNKKTKKTKEISR